MSDLQPRLIVLPHPIHFHINPTDCHAHNNINIIIKWSLNPLERRVPYPKSRSRLASDVPQPVPPAWASNTVLPTRASRSQDGFRAGFREQAPFAVSLTTPVYMRKPVQNAEEEDDGRRMTPKEKALNVRRAQKMTKTFGQAPPHALFQITINNASSTKISINIDFDLTSTTSSLRRQSTTDTLSVPRSPAVVPPQRRGQRIHSHCRDRP
ncbi:hypothetical protein FRC05_006411 [Tulasnella sp. 425]|nr:hypothetical protein FRC05_006411 [Tulasnella sp. 425]